MTSDRLSRRDFLRVGTAAGLGLGTGLGSPLILRAQAKEVVMLGLWSMTGAFADVGPVLDRGMKMALEEHGTSPSRPPPCTRSSGRTAPARRRCST